jgi:isoleucyl-tRNA synthetase
MNEEEAHTVHEREDVTLNKREEEVLRYWEEHDVLSKVRAKNKGKKKFYFLDGPPYVTGDLHPGQMWVKTIKDITLRYRRYRGYDVRDRAGYDVHGLPIENKVEKLLNISAKKEIETKIGIENFVKECRKYVDSYIGRMDKDYARYGISLDFSNPYLAERNEFIEASWSMFKLISDRGYLYKGTKTTAFCIHCGTSLAQGSAEVVYKETEDPSIYVAFKVNNPEKSKAQLGPNTSLVIWTTTPWTLPANVAVAVNPGELYVLVAVHEADYIVAKQRLDSFADQINQSLSVKAEFYGRELEGLSYINPLETKVEKQKEMRKFHKIILSEELVTMAEGTGLVHIAPGHGLEDYLVGMKNKLPIFSPVEQTGVYGREAGAYAGISVPFDANKTVLEDLEAMKAILAKGKITHSYPHCWRCANKLIYLATGQWFFNIQKIKRKLLSENEKAIWHPIEGKKWQASVIESSPDWCISRQRYWGIPLPIWLCKSCGNFSVLQSIEELKERSTERIESLHDLHRPYIDRVKIKCDKCDSTMDRVTDVADVWFDASTAFRTSMTGEEFARFFPVDYIIEGRDQLRGWFSGLLKLGVLAYGKKPFKNIAVDGMLLDEKGREMHKSLGNYIPLEELTKQFGADTFRLWCADHTSWLDLGLNNAEIRDARKTIIILHNVSNLLSEYQELIGYKLKLKNKINTERLGNEEAWIVSKLESLTELVTTSLEGYEAFIAANALKRFIIEDFSRFYLKIAKKNVLYGNRKRAKATIDVINYVLYKSLVMISPITPFVSESVYTEMYKREESIFLESWPKANKKAINTALENEMEIAKDAITALLNSREKAGISLRSPIANAYLEVKDDIAYNSLLKLSGMISEYVNAKETKIKKVAGLEVDVKPLFAKLGPAFKEKAGAVAEALKESDASILKNAIEKNGKYGLHTTLGTVEITAEHFTVVGRVGQGDEALFKSGKAYIDKEISKELKEEAFVREFERGVQMVRKELGLKKSEKISLGYEAAGDMLVIIRTNSKKIAKDLHAAKLLSGLGEGTTKTIKIEGEIVKVSVQKAD